LIYHIMWSRGRHRRSAMDASSRRRPSAVLTLLWQGDYRNAETLT
jgi:hypothetical protein